MNIALSIGKKECMNLGHQGGMMKEPSETVVQQFSYRCPYCDQPVSYEEFDLKEGENRIPCPSCGQIYIKVVQK